MAEVHYLISDASKQVDVESHVLRYWEEELELNIPRNELGHRYYMEDHIRLFRQIKELKEKGYQLKAIKGALEKRNRSEDGIETAGDMMEEDMAKVWEEGRGAQDCETALEPLEQVKASTADQDKMEQFQNIMNHIIGQALEANQGRMGQEVGELVTDKVLKEFEYLLRISDEKEEERFKQLDETIRAYQKDGKGRAEAAATKVPFFRKRKFGKNGKKMV